MIEQLSIHRFRGIRQGRLADFGKLNLLVGRNNTGKSAVLEMLYLTTASQRECAFASERLDLGENTAIAAYAPDPKDFFGHAPWGRIWRRHGQPTIWEGNPVHLSDDQSLACLLKSLDDEHPLRAFRLIPPPSEDIREYGGFSKADVHSVASFGLSSAVSPLPVELLPGNLHRHPDSDELPTRFTFTWYPSVIHANSHNGRPSADDALAVWAMGGQGPFPRYVLFFDFHTAHDHFTSSFRNMAWKTVPNWYEQIEAALGRIYPELASCRVEIAPVESSPESDGYTGFIRLPGGLPISVDHYGDGTRHAFKVLSSLIALKAIASEKAPALFLWEDPELFMHKTAIEALLKEVVNTVRNAPIQVFICTQSREVLSIIARMTETAFIPADDIRAFQLRLPDGRLEAQPFVGETLAVWMEYGLDPREPEMEAQKPSTDAEV